MFERAHHRRIGRVLEAMDGVKLRALGCLFGGDTAIALRYGEYRESVDMDFLVADPEGYRRLRSWLSGATGIDALLRDGASPVGLAREVRVDQYGIRTSLLVEGVAVKFEIVREARIALVAPGRRDKVCGVSTLSELDLAASKLLANADRWRDDSVFSRDAIDLAMMDLPPRKLHPALDKAAQAYGDAAVEDMRRALDSLRSRPERLQRCMAALSMTLPQAVLQQRLRMLRQRLDRWNGRAPPA
ncbi:hypothetical protein E2F46_17185 [Luteimonas aestuarii]|uniref:Nucleotidyl transferase AbiEii/AbiGii toxin family protein n=1 Tax=Luteimonas aestuarii TaxID=453837 RepID=A0A4R5TSK5_9GAMM|nr:nucleotidyl transferase AbiEii/AbiGii toxin family protein [Luteimonas aestuarii]TDK18851.1 hypothetical protein E2F46_17185 [Luteimonas aestuarii]